MRTSEQHRSVIDHPGLRSEYAWLPPHQDASVTKPNQIGVSFTPHRSVVTQHGWQLREADIAPGDVFVTGRAPIVWTHVKEPTEAIELFPDFALLNSLARTSGHRLVEITPAFRTRDPAVLAIGTVLKRAHVAECHVGDVQGSTMAHLLARHLLESYCGVPLALGKARGRLSRVSLLRVTDYIEARLQKQITLDDLAAIVGISPFHFSRLFRRTTGVSPYRYVTMRRMERAKLMFLTTRLSVAAVAEQFGFWNLNHFRQQLRAQTGFLPSDLRG